MFLYNFLMLFYDHFSLVLLCLKKGYFIVSLPFIFEKLPAAIYIVRGDEKHIFLN